MTERDSAAYCGLFCGDCIIKDQKVGEMSQHLLRVIDSPEFRKLSEGLPVINPEFWGDLKQTQEVKSALEAMCNLDCERSCKEGGGSSSCEIRVCCKGKNLNGCWECEEMEHCNVLAAISPVHKGSNIKNMKIIKESGMSAFLAGEKYW